MGCRSERWGWGWGREDGSYRLRFRNVREVDGMYHGRQRAILGRREKIKRLTLKRRKKENLRNAA